MSGSFKIVLLSFILCFVLFCSCVRVCSVPVYVCMFIYVCVWYICEMFVCMCRHMLATLCDKLVDNLWVFILPLC